MKKKSQYKNFVDHDKKNSIIFDNVVLYNLSISLCREFSLWLSKILGKNLKTQCDLSLENNKIDHVHM